MVQSGSPTQIGSGDPFLMAGTAAGLNCLVPPTVQARLASTLCQTLVYHLAPYRYGIACQAWGGKVSTANHDNTQKLYEATLAWTHHLKVKIA